MPPTDVPLILYRDPSVTTASWRSTFLEVWTARGSAPQFRAVRDSHVKCSRTRADRKIAHFTVVHDFTIANLDAEARQVLADRNAATYPHTSRSALVLPATGFAASITRSVITGLSFLARPPFPVLVTSSLDQGARWFSEPPFTAEPYTAIELRWAYERLLARDAQHAATGA